MTIAIDVQSSSSLSELAFVPDKLPEQRRCPAQRPRLDIGKTQHGSAANFLADRLPSNPKIFVAESS